MAYVPIANRISGMPLVLAGPILRRAHPREVHVWVALKEPREISLSLFDSATVVATGDATQTLRLGPHLHIGLASVRLEATKALIPGAIYSYDILFGPGPPFENLANSSGGASLSYSPHTQPTLVVPPADVDDVRVLQASCRKPHGNGRFDALTAVNDILEASANDPTARPQQLVLTGDQIYADDVADPLLFMIRDAADALLAWREPLPGNPSADSLKPGSRQDTVKKANGGEALTSGEARSHLISLDEYCTMYLFAWSDTLWPSQSSSMPEYANLQYSEPEVSPPNKQFLIHTYTDFGSKVTKTGKYFRSKIRRINQFRSTLSSVRRALANIAVYTAFDDHEVTDDWFLTHSWTQRNLADGTLARRMIANGLSAYALFQAWGNDPDHFGAQEPGRDVLNAISAVAQGSASELATLTALESTVLPKYTARRLRYESGLRWHYSVDFPAHRLAVLDTRNHRAYPSGRKYAQLMQPGRIVDQLPTPDPSRPIVVVAATPVFGHKYIEALQLLTGVAGADLLDIEGFSTCEDTRQDLLRQLGFHRRVVILSGDVHYAFSMSCAYQNRLDATGSAAIAQFCSSAAKNRWPSWAEFIFRTTPGTVSKAGWAGDGQYKIEQFGLSVNTGPITIKGPYALIDTGIHTVPADSFSPPLVQEVSAINPDWEFNVMPGQDKRPAAARGLTTLPPLTGSPRARATQGQKHRAKHEGSEVVIAPNNVGLLAFGAGGTEARHVFIYEVTPGSPGGHTEHVLPLKPPGGVP